MHFGIFLSCVSGAVTVAISLFIKHRRKRQTRFSAMYVPAPQADGNTDTSLDDQGNRSHARSESKDLYDVNGEDSMSLRTLIGTRGNSRSSLISNEDSIVKESSLLFNMAPKHHHLLNSTASHFIEPNNEVEYRRSGVSRENDELGFDGDLEGEGNDFDDDGDLGIAQSETTRHVLAQQPENMDSTLDDEGIKPLCREVDHRSSLNIVALEPCSTAWRHCVQFRIQGILSIAVCGAMVFLLAYFA